jgi:hypothetical protein
MIGAFIHNLKEKGDNEYKASEVLLSTQNLQRLTDIIDISDIRILIFDILILCYTYIEQS